MTEIIRPSISPLDSELALIRIETLIRVKKEITEMVTKFGPMRREELSPAYEKLEEAFLRAIKDEMEFL